MKTKIVNRSIHGLPAYSTNASACINLRAGLDKKIVFKPMERRLSLFDHTSNI